MKIRNGFVSNSSSSSFILFGVTLPMRELEESYKEEFEEDFDSLMDSRLKDTGLYFALGLEKLGDDTIVVGINLNKINEEVPLKNEKERVLSLITNAFPEIDFSGERVDFVHDAGYDG